MRWLVYLHAPIWFILYEYRGERYDVIVDGARGLSSRVTFHPQASVFFKGNFKSFLILCICAEEGGTWLG